MDLSPGLARRLLGSRLQPERREIKAKTVLCGEAGAKRMAAQVPASIKFRIVAAQIPFERNYAADDDAPGTTAPDQDDGRARASCP